MSHFLTLINVNCVWNEFDTDMVSEILEPFSANTTNPKYLDFNQADITEEDYKSMTLDCIKLSNGTYIPTFDYRFWGKYSIREGMVYEKEFGKTKGEKRSKKAKRMKYVQSCPISNIYFTFDKYMRDYHEYEYDETIKAYGHYHNYNTMLDWYSIGGKWPYVFLVKVDAFSVVDKYNWTIKDNIKVAPEGYKWVAGARKCDIEWTMMKELSINESTQEYEKLKSCFSTGILLEEYRHEIINEKGIFSWGDALYIDGESLETYLERSGIGVSFKNTIIAQSYIENGEWVSNDDIVKLRNEWFQKLEKYIDSIPLENIIIAIDCNM